ncbi:sulfotransferase ssu-1-like isoform X2 [Argiope bruennichi]|uniref:Sulfotransferase 1C2A like protein n=2 Tax=Argiope bruennichi TaxID=94029 RepID=A0A8T0E0K8_ARGBR|nr:sulfotransferase ssu-1-like isoform X2 [Argiope bruennichi]XP_055937846.1 sulfotransferase ssu-1-like isoform X2 [Argiope bruennichi]XP_055937847.1 sulfotransferase ssu-1-like isoform X2 [Argiope bruennichi]KAF8764262.1 Sulfotransferase 1C2A like protein [Argiope bruennichi]
MGKKPVYGEIDGMLTPPSFVPEVMREAMAFKPGPEDVIVTTYPKCGTTWSQQIVGLILRKGKPYLTAEDYFGTLPFLEMTTMEELETLEKPRCIKTHFPFDRLNFSSEAKYIYVARHPADCVVSFFHHTRFFPIYHFTDGSFDDYFELFIKGEVDWNDYFDHLLSWYEHRNEPNILFLTYENMKKDPREACLQIARFLGDDHYKTLVDNDEEILKKVLEYSSLEFMKKTVNEFWRQQFTKVPSEEFQRRNPVMKKYAKLMKQAAEQGHVHKGNFIRKGVVGEGKIQLSENQLQRLKERIHEKTKHSDVMNLWKTDI